MLKRTSPCYVLAGFCRVNCSKSREGVWEREGEMEERKEQKKISKSQVTCGEGRKDEEGERPYICIFPTMPIFHGKWFFSGNVCTDLVDLSDKQLSHSAIRWDVIALNQKLQPGCHISKILSNCVVRYTYMDLGSSGRTLYLLHRWAAMVIVSVLKPLNLLCID